MWIFEKIGKLFSDNKIKIDLDQNGIARQNHKLLTSQ